MGPATTCDLPRQGRGRARGILAQSLREGGKVGPCPLFVFFGLVFGLPAALRRSFDFLDVVSIRDEPLGPVREAAARVAASYGLDVFDLQFRRESIGWVLRVIVDRVPSAAAGTDPVPENPVSIEDCQRVSQDLDALLTVEPDLAQRLDRQYTL